MLRDNWDSFFYQKWHDSDWVVVGFVDTPIEAVELQRSMIAQFDQGAPGDPDVSPR